MRAVLQRVTSAQVEVEGRVVGRVEEPGLLVYLGVTHDDSEADADWLAAKTHGLRILRDERSVEQLSAPVLVISQFTLYGDARKGRRPTWQAAAPREIGEPLYERFCRTLASRGVRVERGLFGADMRVTSVNDGPMTVLLESS